VPDEQVGSCSENASLNGWTSWGVDLSELGGLAAARRRYLLGFDNDLWHS
jgi:hypothetical protein